MMNVKTHNFILGISVCGSFELIGSNRELFSLNKILLPKRDVRRCIISAKQSQSVNHDFRFSHFCWGNVESLKRYLVSKNQSRLKCSKKPFPLGKALESYLTPLWNERLLLLRAFVYTGIIFGICLLAWYGQSKSKGFIEAKLLPSVCSAISDHIQRKLEFGKVRRISPFSITLESCSFGPHKEEFSCGEAPTVKLRLHPFASLRRGEFVIDAVLLRPSVLVVQKKDYTWLGIPSSEGGMQRHFSTEEGIDHRTKIRSLAREEAAARSAKERDEAARKAAEMGYIVSERTPASSEGNALEDIATQSAESINSKSFYCLNEWKHDRHFWDSGIDYDVKHADLEKSFGVKFPGSGLQVWSRDMQRRRKPKFKSKVNGGGSSASVVAMKAKILEHSSIAAHTYFQGQLHEEFGEAISPSGNFDSVNQDTFTVKSDGDNNAKHVISGDETRNDGRERVTEVRDHGVKTPSLNANVDVHSDASKFVLDRRLQTGVSKRFKSYTGLKVEDSGSEHVGLHSEDTKFFPVTLDSVHIRDATLMLLAYGDREAREIENVNGHVKFQNCYSRVHVRLDGNCKTWRSDIMSEDAGWLAADIFWDTIEQKWHANVKIDNLFVSLFERILEIPITWSKGRASGEVHLCMSRGETFPNLHGQLDLMGADFQLLNASSWFSNISASLRFCDQSIFLHNASGWFGSIPLEASGDFGIHPEEGEIHLMCQIPVVELNALMRTFKMRPLLFPLAGSVTAVFNCQGPLYAPVFVGSGMVSRTFFHINDTPASAASEALANSKEAGALAAFDRIPFSNVSANFTFDTDNCVADLYGIRASLVDGGEIRGAGNVWVCPEGEEDEAAIDVNFSGSLEFDKIMLRYMPSYHRFMPLKLGNINGETKLSGSLLRPRFDIKWTAPKAEGSFNNARGDIFISHDSVTVDSSSAAFDLFMRVKTSDVDDFSLEKSELHAARTIPFNIDEVGLDLRMRDFEMFSLGTTLSFDSPRPLHLKTTGKIKFQGRVSKPGTSTTEQTSVKKGQQVPVLDKRSEDGLVGEVLISGFKLNQLMLAPQLSGFLRVSPKHIKLEASGRPDESLAMEFVGPLQVSREDGLPIAKLLSLSLQKGQLKTNISFRPLHSANLEVRHFPLDELELASLRGIIEKAEIQLNFQKRRGHGVLSVLKPKFSGVLGEALDMAARWSGDVITFEKIVLEQNYSRYEVHGEYVLPGAHSPVDGKGGGFLKKPMSVHLSSVISSMGRWRMKLEVPRAEVAEALPLARLFSRSMDPAVRSRSKDLFIQSLQSVGLYAENLQEQLEMIREHQAPMNDVLEDLNLPGLSEFKGRWHASLDASGGGNGDTLAEFDFQGENWEWGDYKSQHLWAAGAYSNDDGLHLEKFFIQKDNATIHADGTLLGPKTNLHFAVLNFPVSLVPTLIQVIESATTDAIHSLQPLLAPIGGILHMEGDLRGTLAKPECDLQVRLLDGAIGGVDLGRAEVLASLTSASRFLFSAKFEPMIQNGHVHIQGSIPVSFVQINIASEDVGLDKNLVNGAVHWMEKNKAMIDDARDKKVSRDGNEGWNTQLEESLKGIHWKILDVEEVKVDVDIIDGGMMLLAALTPYANWLYGNADIMLECRGTVGQPILNGYASFDRASISSPVLRKPLTNFGGTVHIKSNRLCIPSMESRVSRKGKLLVKGNLPLRSNDPALGDKIELKCEVLEVQAENFSGQVDSQVQITGSLLQPNVSGNIQISHGVVNLPHDRSAATASTRFPSNQSMLPTSGVSRVVPSRYVSQYFNSEHVASRNKLSQSSIKLTQVERDIQVERDMEQLQIEPNMDIRLSDLKLVLGPELKIIYPLILDFAVSGDLELNGLAHPKCIKPKGILALENGEVGLGAPQMRLKREHINIAKFEPEYGLDPMLDLALVGSEWQVRIHGRASNWQKNLVVASAGSGEQSALSPDEAVRRLESHLAESILEDNGRLAINKFATETLKKLMPRIEGKGEYGQARWRIVYAPQISSLMSVDPTADPLKLLANTISIGTEVEVQLGKRVQATIVRQMKESEMAVQGTLSYQLTNRLRLLLQSAPSKRLLFEYSAILQD
ncbi:hypothetical protein QN277_015167 [Acacia crassicarpa]|uniref:Translocation and assembly module TamB C-terminal domain-containing protein n=1 Tax=Acacia crassicarpa TaxID=499986 RepID=A0AAE1MT41_9FABA|nr:hypothetical protein QN277_015167 [Acacia crassicarpa]